MVTYEHLRFLNLQYWYCIAYSLFGGKCTAVDELDGTLASTTLSVPTPAPVKTDFWGWLFGKSGDTVAHTGLFGAILDAIAFIGGILAFLWGIFSVISYTLSGLLFLGVLGSFLGLLYIRYQEIALYGTLAKDTAQTGQMRSRWQLILDLGMSASPKDWREGIFEADVMLGEVLEKFGYQGATTADKLRSVPEGAFVTLPNAWEAHRIKNFVSAGSSDFILTQREAFRVLKLYEQVFEEFNFV
jgi:hypothetical protein